MDSTEEVAEQNCPAVPQRQASAKRRRAYGHTKLALVIISVIGVVTILGSFTLEGLGNQCEISFRESM